MRASIIVPFRRLAPIPLCLTSLEVCEGIDEHQIILIQQGGKRFDFARQYLDAKYVHIADDGPFDLAKLQNAAVKIARTEWVTFLDPCLTVPPNFITVLESAGLARGHRLIYFPIRHLDSDTTELIARRFNSFYETVIPLAANWRLRCETYKGYPVGTDCFAVGRSDYLDAGGCDERYQESGLAQIDFAWRWLNKFGPPGRAACDVYHRWRRLEFWTGDGLDETRARSTHVSLT
ncbi:MAG: hypothetical protein ABSC42_18540 [Tepidisphaeraceae bacterium]|jgi:predicted glycosyltransferase involved in capsule biosynthesis